MPLWCNAYQPIHSHAKCANELAEVRTWADGRIAAQTEQMELQSEEAKLVAARSKEETKVEVARLMEVRRGTRLYVCVWYECVWGWVRVFACCTFVVVDSHISAHH